MALTLLIAAAFGGYGDASDGRPNHEEREVHLWTNAVRADPAGFEDDYPCSYSSFSSSEKSTKGLLQWDDGLGEAARYHSADMDQNNWFDHDSSDGTSWSTRIYRYYEGWTIAENIAWGYSDPYAAVIDGWMCSSGHRADIMSSSYDEMGTGVVGSYYTQDFGSGVDQDHVMKMGVHLPKSPGSEATLAVDFDSASAPDEIYAVVDGERHNLALTFGSGDRGVYTAQVSTTGACQPYYFVAALSGLEARWPEDGSYGWGACEFDDTEAGWIDEQLEWTADPTEPGGTDPGGTDPGGTTPGPGTNPTDGTGDSNLAGPGGVDEEPGGCGCASNPGLLGWMALLPAALLIRRRR